jgi:DNA-binding MarR family transcriptional regulator
MVKDSGLTKTQKVVLDALKGGHSVKEIADARNVSLNSIYQVLHRLVERGLVEKQYKANFIVK